MWEFNFTIDTSRSKKGRVKNIDSVGRHDNFDGLGGFESVKLIQQLEHSTLNL